jgi:probable HAF family extracellular repeat protein
LKRLMAVAAIAVVSIADAQTTQPYFVSLMQVPKGATAATVVSIDEVGNAYGNATYNGHTIPTVWQAGSHATHTLPDTGTGVYADGVDYQLSAASGNGLSAGTGVNSSGTPGGVYWDSTGRPWELVAGTEIDAVSDNAIVVGTDYLTSPLVWKNGVGQATRLPSPWTDGNCADPSNAEYCSSGATAISPNGRYILGWSMSAFEHYDNYPAVWLDGRLVSNALSWGYLYDINNSGMAVGSSANPAVDELGDLPGCPRYIYPPLSAYKSNATTATPLPGLKNPDCDSVALSINASGVVVGASSIDPQWDHHAVLWNGTKITDLHTLLMPLLPANTVLTSASKITDNGKILLSARNSKTNASSYYVATPTISTRITISSNVNPSSYGQPIHLVASVIPASGGVPLGSVTWYDGGKLVATAGLTRIGTASWEPSTLSPGVHQVTAKYAAYSPDGASQSSIFNQTVHVSSTKTSLISSTTSVNHGQAFTLTATVVPAFGAPSGSVTFMTGSTKLGTASVDSSRKQAKLTTSIAKAGKNSITGIFGPTANFSGSTSAAVTLTVK